jgi:hypothetical protein
MRLVAGTNGETIGGLASEATAEFMRMIGSAELRLSYFLKVLCRSGLADGFAGEVRGLGHLYADSFGEILRVVAENESVSDLLVDVLLSDVTVLLIDELAARASEIIERRQVVEFVGKFLRRQDLDCHSVVPVVNLLFKTYPERGDNVADYLEAFARSGVREVSCLVDVAHGIIKNPANVEPFVSLLLDSRYSPVEIKRMCPCKEVEFVIGMLALVAGQAIAEDVVTPEFVEFCGNRIEKLRPAWVNRPVHSLLPLLLANDKAVRKKTMAVVQGVLDAKDQVLLENLLRFQNFEDLINGPNAVQLFKIIFWLADRNRFPLAEFRADLIRVLAIVRRYRTPWNAAEFHLDRILVGIDRTPSAMVREMFCSLLWSVGTLPLKKIERVMGLFLGEILTMETQDPVEFGRVVQSDEFYEMVRVVATAVPRPRSAALAKLITCVEDWMRANQEYYQRFRPLFH